MYPNDIINYVEVGNHKYFLGLFDKEKGYDEFVTLGAKKYAFNQNGKIGITVAGLNKKSGAKELELKGGLSNFKIGTEFSIVEEKQYTTMTIKNIF